MAGTFWGDHHHIDLLGRYNLSIVNIESMGEQKGLSFFEMGLDILFVKLSLDMILSEDLDQIGLFGRLSCADRLETVPKGKLIILTPLPLGDDDVETAISQVLSLGMPLTSVTNNGNHFSFQVNKICIFVVIYLHFFSFRLFRI